MTYHTYYSFGLKIASEIEFTEMYPMNYVGAADIKIKLCEDTFNFNQFDASLPYSYHSTGNIFFIYIKTIAGYKISNGNTILIYPFPDAILSEIRACCLSNAFAAILHQRFLLPLHAGAIIHDEKVSLILGNPGVGKSTLLFHLMQKDWNIFSDDVVVVSSAEKNTEFHATSSYPLMKLWKYQMALLGSTAEFQMRKGVDKFPYFFHNRYDMQKRKIEKLIILNSCAQSNAVDIKELKGIEALILLSEHIYRKEFMSKNGFNIYMPICAQLVNNIPCYEIKRPHNLSTEKIVLDFFLSVSREKKIIEGG